MKELTQSGVTAYKFPSGFIGFISKRIPNTERIAVFYVNGTRVTSLSNDVETTKFYKLNGQLIVQQLYAQVDLFVPRFVNCSSATSEEISQATEVTPYQE